MLNKILIISTLFLLSANVKAQVNIGSPYSRFGLGEIENINIGRAGGMGGITSGLRMLYEINPENPATYSAIPNKIFLFQSGFKFKGIKYSVTDESVKDINFSLNSVNAAFSINKFWGMSFGMNPLSNVNYYIYTRDTLTTGNIETGFANKYIGEGGLTKLYLGNAFAYKKISFGINASYIFGPLVKRTESYIVTEGYSSSVYSLTDSKLKAFHLRYGVQYSDSIFKKYIFTTGGYFENKTDLNTVTTKFVKREIKHSSDITIRDTLMNDTIAEGKMQMPLSFGFGFSLISDKWIFGTDYKFSAWKDVSFFGEKPTYMSDSYRISAGAEYTDDYTSKKFFKKLNWRFGAHYSESGIILNNTHIKNIGINFGLGIPTKLGAKLNLGFELGTKGTTKNNLVKEDYFMINFNVNFTDRWFIRRRFF